MLDKKYNSLEKEEKWLNYWKENKIVSVFSVITLICCIIALYAV